MLSERSFRELAATNAGTASRKNKPRRSHRIFTLKLSSCFECTADEMSPDALKDEPFWGPLAKILREIGPSDEELDTIRKRLLAQLNRVPHTHSQRLISGQNPVHSEES